MTDYGKVLYIRRRRKATTRQQAEKEARKAGITFFEERDMKERRLIAIAVDPKTGEELHSSLHVLFLEPVFSKVPDIWDKRVAAFLVGITEHYLHKYKGVRKGQPRP